MKVMLQCLMSFLVKITKKFEMKNSEFICYFSYNLYCNFRRIWGIFAHTNMQRSEKGYSTDENVFFLMCVDSLFMFVLGVLCS